MNRAIQLACGAVLISGLGTSTPSLAQYEDGWWSPPPGSIRVYHDIYNHNPITVYTIPIDGVSHGGYTIGGDSTTVGSLETKCDGTQIQIGRIYPHTSYDEYQYGCPD